MRSRRLLRSCPPVAVAAALLALSGCSGEAETRPVASGGGDAVPSAAPSETALPEVPGVEPTAAAAPASPSASASAAAGGTGAAPAPAASAGATPSAGAGAPFEADTSPDLAEPEGNGLTVTDVEVGGHEGYDRVVFTLGGEGVPGWRVAYVDAPSRQGSGEPFAVPGSAFLSVLVSGVGYPYDTGVTERANVTLGGTDGGVVRGVVTGATHEGQYEAAVGLAERMPFRVFRLDGPPRVVVDVAHDG